MKILLVTEYFPPEVGATQARLRSYAQEWARTGHDVTVVTAFPHYPSGTVPIEYSNKSAHWTDWEGIKIFRVPFLTQKSSSHSMGRLYRQFRFGLRLGFHIFKFRQADVIFAEYPPIFILPFCILLSKLFRIPLVIHISDCWGKAAVDLGVLKGRFLAGLTLFLERECLKRATGYITVTDGVESFFKNIMTHKHHVQIPNGVDVKLYFRDIVAREKIRKLRNWVDKFVVVYAGVIGNQQDFDVVLESAKILPPAFRIVLIGDGAMKPSVVNQINTSGVNIEILPALPEEELSQYLSAADAGISTLRNLPFCETVIPVKIWSYLACGLPTVATEFGESGRLLRKLDLVRLVPPNNSAALAEIFVELSEDPDGCAKMATAGVQYVRNFRSRAQGAKEAAAFFQKILG